MCKGIYGKKSPISGWKFILKKVKRFFQAPFAWRATIQICKICPRLKKVKQHYAGDPAMYAFEEVLLKPQAPGLVFTDSAFC